jgi:hypothetical protein
MLPEPTLGSNDCADAGAARTVARAAAATDFFMTSRLLIGAIYRFAEVHASSRIGANKHVKKATGRQSLKLWQPLPNPG